MKKIFSLFVAALFCASMMADTWTVAGTPASVFGTEWTPSDVNNDMTLVDGVYKLVKENVTASKGDVKFKVCKNHAWSEAYPSSDYSLTIAEDGKYDITITFNESSKAISATATKKGDVVIEKHYLVAGEALVVNGAGWDNNNPDNLMTSTDEGATYKLRIEGLVLSAKNYEFKIVEKGTWTAYYDNGAGGNATFNIAEAGTYTIEYVFTVATSQCVVNATKTGSAEIDVKYYLTGNTKGWEIAAANVFTVNPSDENEYFINTTLAKGETLKVAKAENGVITTWYPEGMGTEMTVGDEYVGEKTIYFRPAKGDGWTLLDGYIWMEANTPTALDNAQVGEKAVKMIENGQLVIIKNGVKYSVLGIRVK